MTQSQAESERFFWRNLIPDFQGVSVDGCEVFLPGFAGVNIQAIG
jgi:hypothetical protein